MKKFFVSILAMLAMAVSFVSCSDEDEITADVVVGSYDGLAKMSVDVKNQETGETTTQDLGEHRTSAVITLNSENSIKIAITGFGSGHYTMPSFEIPIVQVDGVNEDMALLYGTDFEFTHNNIVYSGKMQGTYSKDKVSLMMTITPGAMPMPINLTMVFARK